MARPTRSGLALIVLSGLWVVLVLVAMLLRARFPLELEWMEGGSLHQARRVLDGDPIYAQPSADFIPFLYTPLYPALIALGGAVFGLGYGVARGVSILATIAAGLAIWSILGQEKRSLVHRAAGVGLFFSGYVFTFRWLDLARADATFLALLLWALYWLRRADLHEDESRSWRSAVLAGLFMALAFWTKQTAALFVVGGGLWTLRMHRRSLIAFGTTIAIVDGVGVLLGQAMTEGWLWTYIYELHQSHEFNRVRFTRKTWGMFLHAAPFLVSLLMWRGWVSFRSSAKGAIPTPEDSAPAPPSLRRGRQYWAWMTALAVLASALGYSTQWAEPNAFLPGVALGAVLCPLMCPAHLGGSTQGRVAAGMLGAQMIFALLVEPQYQSIQDRGLRGVSDSYRWQDPWRTIPRAAQVKRARELRTWIEDEGSKLWAPQRPWWSSIGGGPGHVGSMGLNDIPKERRRAVRRELREQLKEGKWRGVWIEGSLASWSWLRPTLVKHFRLAQRRQGSERVLPMIGFMSEAGMVRPYTAPQLRFEAIEAPVVPAGWMVVEDFEQPKRLAFEFEGRAFARRSVPSIHGKLPAVGPIGGGRFLSSAASVRGLRGEGRARSEPFALPKSGGVLHLLAGISGEGKGCSLVLIDEEGRRLELAVVAQGDWSLAPVHWQVEPGWAGRKVRLEVKDEDAEAAIFVDEIYVEGP